MRDKKRRDSLDENALETEKVSSILEEEDGLTITDLVNKTKLSRSAIRTALAILEGAKKVSIRKIGMAKVYSLK
jgi:DNA-binding transcriptional ArsR family regulator